MNNDNNHLNRIDRNPLEDQFSAIHQSKVLLPSPLSQSHINEIPNLDLEIQESDDDIVDYDNDNDNDIDSLSASNLPLKKGRKLGAKYSLIPDGAQNIDINMRKRKRQAPLPFNSQVNNAIASSSKAPVRTRGSSIYLHLSYTKKHIVAPKADPYNPQVPPPDFAKPDYKVIEQLFEPFIKKQFELQAQGQTPPPVRFPVNKRPDYIISSAPRIPQNYIVPVPLDTYTKADYKTRKWSDHTKEIRSISGSKLRLKTWLGSEESEYSKRPPPPVNTTKNASNQGEDPSTVINPANIMTPSGVPLSKLDKRTREYKTIMAQHKAQLEQKRLDEERQRLEAKAAFDGMLETNKSEDDPSRMSINNIVM